MAYVNKIKIEENDPRDIMESVGTRIFRGTCNIAGSAEVKDVTLDDSTNFTLEDGIKVAVTFTNANTNSSPKLNVNGSGSIPINIYNSSSYTSSDGNTYNTWGDYETVIFTLKGSSIDSAVWVNSGSGKGIGAAYDLANSAITTAGTGLVKNDKTINHSNSISAGTAGTSSATSGPTLDVPYITYDAQGHITATGTHTHTVNGTENNKVTQYNTFSNGDFRVLLSGTSTDTDVTTSTYKTNRLIFNPSTKTLTIAYDDRATIISNSSQKVENTSNPEQNTTQYYNGVVATDGTHSMSFIPTKISYSGGNTDMSLIDGRLEFDGGSYNAKYGRSSAVITNGTSTGTYGYSSAVITNGTDTVTLRPTLIQTSGTVKAGESVEVGRASANGSVEIRQASASSDDPYNLKFKSASSRYMAQHGTQYSRMYDSGASGTAPVESGSVNNTTRSSNGYYASDNTSFSAATKGSAMTREDGFVAKDGSEVVTHNSNGLAWDHRTGDTSSIRMYTLGHTSTVTAETTYTIDLPYGTYLFLHSRQTTAGAASTGMQLVIIGQSVGSSAIIKTTAESGAQIGATSGTRSQVEISNTRQGATSESTDRIATVTWTVQGLSYRRLIMVRLM